jgi:hypothetical protein
MIKSGRLVVSLNDVNMRNDFEDFDERLDRWCATTKTRHFVDLHFGDVKKLFLGFDDGDFFRNGAQSIVHKEV